MPQKWEGTASDAVPFDYSQMDHSVHDRGAVLCYSNANQISGRGKWLPT